MSNGMSRKDRIDDIIRRRKKMAERVMRAKKEFDRYIVELDRFRLDANRRLEEANLDGEFDELRAILKETESLGSKGAAQRDELGGIFDRLSRPTLNIAVVGMAGQGKSLLLQKITGLTATEIPDSKGSSCTGVRSEVRNDPEVDSARADVFFWDEDEFIREVVAPYFEDEEFQNAYPDLPTPRRLVEFENMHLPELDHEEKIGVRSALDHLWRLKRNLGGYRDYLGKKTEHIGREKIRGYVAQYDDQKEPIFAYAAVKNVEITCRFPNEEDVGKLKLIDLPGLGETRKGYERRIVDTLKDEVDLVFVIDKPEVRTDQRDTKREGIYRILQKAFKRLPIDRCSFWVLNHDAENGDNEDQCKDMKRALDSDSPLYKVSRCVIVDCSREAEVFENLIDPALEYLANHIEENDREYAKTLEENVTSTVRGIRDLMERGKKFFENLKDDGRDSDHFRILFSAKLWDAEKGTGPLPVGIRRLTDAGSKLRRNAEEDCESLRQKIISIIENEEKRMEEENHKLNIGSEDFDELVTARDGNIRSAVGYILSEQRTQLSWNMQAPLDDILEKFIEEVQDEVCKILGGEGRNECLLGRHFKDDAGQPLEDHRLLRTIVNFIEANQELKGKIPTLYKGFKLLNDWTMNYSSFLQYRIRFCLRLLDPIDEGLKGDKGENCREEITGGKALVKKAEEIFDEDGFESMMELIRDKYRTVLSELRGKFGEIYTEPNKAAFAIVEEFKDQVIRSGGERKEGDNENLARGLRDQWAAFYEAIRGSIWAMEFGTSQVRQDVLDSLRGPVQALFLRSEPSNFKFLG